MRLFVLIFLSATFPPTQAAEKEDKTICIKESNMKKMALWMRQCVEAVEACDKAYKRKAAICPLVKLDRKSKTPSNVSSDQGL